jgi:hypothetical protein
VRVTSPNLLPAVAAQGAALLMSSDGRRRWSAEVYGRHKHRGLDGQTPASVFAAVEAQALMPLPPRVFESVVYGLGRVAPDCQGWEGVVLGAVAAHRPIYVFSQPPLWRSKPRLIG